MTRRISRNLTRGAIICLALVMALAAMGMGYAGVNGGVHNTGQVAASSCGGPFTWVVSNDDGAEDDADPYGIIDPGDDGLDPSEPQSPGVECARYDKDVAGTTAWISGEHDEINVLVENAYPGYYPTVFFGLKCPDLTPGTIVGIGIDNPYEYALTVSVSGISEEQAIPAGEEVVGAVHVRVEQAARQNHEYSFSIRITIKCQPECEWQGETAMAEGNTYPNHAWFMYTPYADAPFAVDLIAAQHYTVGTVEFSAPVDGWVTITIILDEDVRFDPGELEVSIKGYTDEPDAISEGSWPFCTWPYKGDVDPDESSFSMDVPAYGSDNEPYLFYAVHVNVEYLVCP